MGNNQAAPHANMDSLLASLRKVVDAGSEGDRLNAVTVPANDQGSFAAQQNASQLNTQISPEEEISNLRRRIAGKLAREGQSGGFATILGGRPNGSELRDTALLVEERIAERPVVQSRLEVQPLLRQALEDADMADLVDVQQPRHSAEPATSWRQTYQSAPASAKSIGYRDRAEFRDSGLMSETSSATANAAFNRLAETVMSRAIGDRSIEDLTRELLRSMLKQWLDENLPQLVERIVRDEIERVARRGTRR